MSFKKKNATVCTKVQMMYRMNRILNISGCAHETESATFGFIYTAVYAIIYTLIYISIIHINTLLKFHTNRVIQCSISAVHWFVFIKVCRVCKKHDYSVGKKLFLWLEGFVHGLVSHP